MMTSYTVTYSSRGRCEYDVDCPSSTYHDRTGHLSMWGVSKIQEETANICADHGFMPIRDMCRGNDIRLFLVNEKRIMFPTFHSKFSLAGRLSKYHVSCVVSSFTPNSFSNQITFSDISSKLQYFQSEVKCLAINWKTRKSTTFPKSYFEKSSKLVDHGIESLMSKTQEVIIPPDTAFKSTFQTRYSDIDINSHLNYAEYYRMCSDVSSKASVFGYYRHFTSDIVKYPVMQTEATFLGECGPDEQLVIYTWQDEHDCRKLYFAIYLKGVKKFQASFTYDTNASKGKITPNL